MQYLHDKQYYIDIFDLITVKECLRVIDTFKEIYKDSKNDDRVKDVSEEDRIKTFNQLLHWKLLTVKGEKYRHRSQRIEEMYEDDKKKQKFYDNALEPSNINCKTCGKHIFSETKILEDYMDTPMRVLFYFPCKTCNVKRAVYNTGEEYESKPLLCPKCKSEINESHKIKGKGEDKIIIWKKKCPSCKFEDEIIDDFAKKRAQWKKEKEEDKQLLEKYRDEFCLSDEKGKEYIELIEAMEVANVVHDEEMQKYDNSAYQKSLQLKKTNIPDLEKLLNEVLEKGRYIKLSLEKPEISEHVIVPFNVQDSDSSRDRRLSSSELEKIIKTVLEDTNWRLISNSIIYRLGYLEGKLKGYESEEDLLKLSGKKEEKKVQSKIDEAKRQKYASNNLVQIARLTGQHQGIENMRKRRLEKEPKGFFLESSEGPYNCGICSESTPGNRTWWDLNGIRCVDCQSNLEEGVYPAEICKNDKLWIKEFQLQYDYSIHPATRRKLIKQGVLKGTELKRQDGTTYCTIFLINDNKEFFKKYPKKPKMKIEWNMVDDKGNKIKL